MVRQTGLYYMRDDSNDESQFKDSEGSITCRGGELFGLHFCPGVLMVISFVFQSNAARDEQPEYQERPHTLKNLQAARQGFRRNTRDQEYNIYSRPVVENLNSAARTRARNQVFDQVTPEGWQ